MDLKAKIKKWLDIQPPVEIDKELRKDIDTQVRKLESELEYWKNTFRTYSRVPCANCGKEMHVYPFGGAYYTVEGKKVHAKCYDEYLEKRTNERETQDNPPTGGDDAGAPSEG